MWKLIDPKERNLIIEGITYKPPKQSLQEFLNDLNILRFCVSFDFLKRIKSVILWPIGIYEASPFSLMTKQVNFKTFICSPDRVPH